MSLKLKMSGFQSTDTAKRKRDKTSHTLKENICKKTNLVKNHWFKNIKVNKTQHKKTNNQIKNGPETLTDASPDGK